MLLLPGCSFVFLLIKYCFFKYFKNLMKGKNEVFEIRMDLYDLLSNDNYHGYFGNAKFSKIKISESCYKLCLKLFESVKDIC